MRRRTLISASMGWGALAGAAGVHSWVDAPAASAQAGGEPMAGLTLYSGSDTAFGTTVTIKLLHSNALQAQRAIEAAFLKVKTIDALMSLHQERSQVVALNKKGFVDAPDRHLLHVLAFTQYLSGLTDGAFDITVQPLWSVFSAARATGMLPSPEAIAEAQSRVSWQRLKVVPQQVRLGTPGMGITLNGVAQGYAVDLALEALAARDIQHALVDTGEFGAVGRNASAASWMLGVAHPRQPGKLSSRVKMDARRVATSGDYATFFSSDFVHHHIFDPATGDSPPELASVTVVAPTGILADGLSTALMVMGAKKAFQLVARLPNVDIMLIDKAGRMQKTVNFPDA